MRDPCPKCGRRADVGAIADGPAAVCNHCGKPLAPASEPNAGPVPPAPPPLPPVVPPPPPGHAQRQDLGDSPGMGLILPVNVSGWAIASGYLGLFSVLALPAPLAVITGILAVMDLKKHPNKRGWVRAIVGLVLGGLGTIVLAFTVLLIATRA